MQLPSLHFSSTSAAPVLFKMLMLSAMLLLAAQTVRAQGMAVGTGNPTPDASAMLDVQSTAKGMLAPRLTTAQRNLIATPATGLLIFNSTTNQFEFWTGIAWSPVGAGLVLPYSQSASSSTNDLFSITNVSPTGKVNTLSGITNSTTDSSSGIFGLANTTSGKTFGVFGRTSSTDGYGVFGQSISETGSSIGGYFTSLSPTGRGVGGFASASTGSNRGGNFNSNGTSGIGTAGFATALTGTTFGVSGQAFSESGIIQSDTEGVVGVQFARGNHVVGQAANGPCSFVGGRPAAFGGAGDHKPADDLRQQAVL